jgi:hypothetical protein
MSASSQTHAAATIQRLTAYQRDMRASCSPTPRHQSTSRRPWRAQADNHGHHRMPFSSPPAAATSSMPPGLCQMRVGGPLHDFVHDRRPIAHFHVPPTVLARRLHRKLPGRPGWINPRRASRCLQLNRIPAQIVTVRSEGDAVIVVRSLAVIFADDLDVPLELVGAAERSDHVELGIAPTKRIDVGRPFDCGLGASGARIRGASAAGSFSKSSTNHHSLAKPLSAHNAACLTEVNGPVKW